MKKDKTIKLKFFVLGFISASVLGLAVFGIIKLLPNKSNDKTNSNITEIDGYVYEKNIDSQKYTCDKLEDVWIMGSTYFITNSGEIYKFNSEKKFSENNQNCIRESLNLVVNKYYDGAFLATDGKYYRFDFDEFNRFEIKETDMSNSKVYLDYFKDEDIKFVKSFKFDDENKKNHYYVIKTDGKIYEYVISWYFDDDAMERVYVLDSAELFYSIDNEYIKYYEIEYEESDKFKYIVTDKGIYVPEAVNKECETYEDIKCEYKYVKEKYMNSIFKDVIYLGYADNSSYSYYSKTNYVRISKNKKEN